MTHTLRDEARLMNKQAKLHLPVVFFQGFLKHPTHNADDAEESGLVALDVDDHDGLYHLDPDTYIADKILPRINAGELDEIVFVYVTSSGAGMRIIALSTHPEMSLESQQKALFKKVCPDLPDKALDTGKCSPASAFFIPCRDDVRFLDSERMFNGEVEVEDDEKLKVTENIATSETTVPKQNTAMETEDDVHSLKYGDLFVDDIIQAIIQRYHYGFKKGNRNNQYYDLACFGRHLVKVPEKLMDLLPSMGLSLNERKSCIKSAFKELKPEANIPHALQRVIDELSGIISDEDDSPKLPKRLPRGMETILYPFPKSHREAMAIIALPGLAQIGHKARFVINPTQEPDYNGDMITFMAFQLGLFASGKSSGTKLVNRLVREHLLIDEETKKKMMEFNDENEIAGDGEKKKDPHFGIYNIEADTNLPAFNKNMVNLKGKPCIIVTPEIDEMRKPISFLRDKSILRKAYDQDMTGQLRSTSKGFSGSAKIYFNLAAAGTVGAVLNYFNDVANGEVSRMLFCSFPNDRGEKYVPDLIRSSKNQEALDVVLGRLSNWEQPEKPYAIRKIKEALDDWAEEKRIEFNLTGDEAMESFRRRCKIQGVKAGAIAFMLEGGRETKTAINFALWVAKYSLYQLLKYFGKKMAESANEDLTLLTTKCLKPHDQVFMNLPDNFNYDDVRQLYQGLSLSGSGYRNIVRRWKCEGFVEMIEGKKGYFRKTQHGMDEAQNMLMRA